MKTAAFRLDNYIFDRVSLDLSNLKPETTFNIDFIPSGKFFTDKDQYELTFVFTANHSETNEPVVNVRCVAQFSFHDRADDTLTAELTLNEKTHQWEVRTAQPRSDVEKDKLLWRKENGKPAKSLP